MTYRAVLVTQYKKLIVLVQRGLHAYISWSHSASSKEVSYLPDLYEAQLALHSLAWESSQENTNVRGHAYMCLHRPAHLHDYATLGNVSSLPRAWGGLMRRNMANDLQVFVWRSRQKGHALFVTSMGCSRHSSCKPWHWVEPHTCTVAMRRCCL
jgi:hypothetical protein